MGIDFGIDECVNRFSAYRCIHTNVIVSYNPNKLAPAGGVHYPLFQFWNRHYESAMVGEFSWRSCSTLQGFIQKFLSWGGGSKLKWSK